MRLKTLPLLVVLSAIVFSSCQKEIDFVVNQNNNNNNNTSNDSIYLKQYVEIDTTFPAGLDTLFKIDVYYDNQKRVTGHLLTEFVNNLSQYILTDIKYFYNGTDTLPYRTTEHVQDGAYSYLDTTFLTYLNGKVFRDSSIFYRENNHELLYTSTTSYTASGNNVFVRSRDVSYLLGTPDVTMDSGMVNLTMSGGNILMQTATSASANEDYYQLSYDSKINPFYRVDIHYPIFGGYNSSFDSSPNNPLSERNGSSSSSITTHFSVTYSYRQDGYPVVRRIVNMLDPSETSKGFYYYTRL